MTRPLTALLLALAVAATACLAAPAGAAASGGTCNLVLPARIAVHDIVVTPRAHASGSCTKALAEAEWSSARGYDPYAEDVGRQPVGYAAYNRGPGDLGPGHYGTDADVEYFPGELPWGRLTFYPAYAGRDCTRGVCRTTYVQNEAVTDVRLATRSALTATRHAGRVVLRATASVYSSESLRYRPHAVRGRFETRRPGGAWSTLREGVTTSQGRAGTTVRAPRGRQYRYVVITAAHWWGSAGPAVTR